MDDIEVPQYFICPISLQIMKDPVTTITGITYDRESIERWLFATQNTACPVTKQPLPKDLDCLTPNHTLLRLIQAWCTENASRGIDRIPTPKPCVDKFHIVKLLKNLWHPELEMETLTRLELMAAENERNRKYMMEAGVAKAMLLCILSCFKKEQISGLQEALSILCLIRIPSSESRVFVSKNDQIIESLAWVLGCNIDNHTTVKSHAVSVLKELFEEASSSVLERLKPEFFDRIVGVLKQKISQQGINAALNLLLYACPWARNKKMMVDSGAVFELIEIELRSPERRTTELVLGILFHLCSCADGRAQFLSHGCGIAVVSERILRVSPAADDQAVLILSLISKYSGTHLVLQEMLNVKAVSKLCTLLQVDCASYLKDKAREILRSHFDEWKNSPCIFGFSPDKILGAHSINSKDKEASKANTGSRRSILEKILLFLG